MIRKIDNNHEMNDDHLNEDMEKRSTRVYKTRVNRSSAHVENNNDQYNAKDHYSPDYNDEKTYDDKIYRAKQVDGLNWIDLILLNYNQLLEKYPHVEVPKTDNVKRSDLLFSLLQSEFAQGRQAYVEGIFDIMPDGYGFIRFSEFCYLSSGDDIYVSHQLIRNYQLKVGDKIYGTIRLPRNGDKYFGLDNIITLNGNKPVIKGSRVHFEKLTPLYPNRRINLTPKNPKDGLVLRMIDIVAPLGFGQRALIVAPPKTGKTEMLQAVAHAITDNHPEVKLFVLLIDERPEEVTDMERSVKGEVISSTFDEQASRHVQVAEMLLERSKRLVEQGHDVVILLDAITRLARAYNTTCPSSGKVLTGGVEANALHKPKRFFGAARNIEGGGSLTILATALIETNSKMDEVIFEEFKGTGNSEIQLSRTLAERGSYPAININASSTRKDVLLLTEDELAKRTILRRVLHKDGVVESTELLLDKLKTTKTNAEFFAQLSKL